MQGSVRDPVRPQRLRSDPCRPSSELLNLPRQPGRHHPLHQWHGVRRSESVVAYAPWLLPGMLRSPADLSFCVISGYRGWQIPFCTQGKLLECLAQGPGLGLGSAAPGVCRPQADSDAGCGHAARLPNRNLSQDSIPSLTGGSSLSAQTSACVASSLRSRKFKFPSALMP